MGDHLSRPTVIDMLASLPSLLVTGGAGFIGSNFVLSVVGQARVVNLDKLTYAGNLENLASLRTIRLTSSCTATSAIER